MNILPHGGINKHPGALPIGLCIGSCIYGGLPYLTHEITTIAEVTGVVVSFLPFKAVLKVTLGRQK